MRGTRLTIAIAGCALAAAIAPLGAMADKPSYGCPPGMNLGSYTFQDYLGLPRTQAAINDGLVTTEATLAALAAIDNNGNGSVCVQLRHGDEVNSRPFGPYFYNVTDDNASVPS
jgi:hypothetical protein